MRVNGDMETIFLQHFIHYSDRSVSKRTSLKKMYRGVWSSGHPQSNMEVYWELGNERQSGCMLKQLLKL